MNERYIEIALRVSPELLELLQKASARYHLSYSEIARYAQRRYVRLSPKLKPECANNGTPLRLFVVVAMDADLLRAILRWYIGLHDLRKPRAVDLQALEAKYGSLAGCHVITPPDTDQ